MELPRFIVLQAPDAEKYLRYRPSNGIYKGYAEFTGTKVVSADAKFEVEFANYGLVHIRSCTKNKYLKRTHNPSITRRQNEEYWITITADKPEEDTTKESCTLFQPILEDALQGNYRFVHVQSGHYLCLWPLATTRSPKRGVLANHNGVAYNRNDIFKVINWESLVILPRFVAFKGHNNKFLSAAEFEVKPFLKFSSEDVGGRSVTTEVIYMNNGDIRFKTIHSNKFWKSTPSYISADSDDTKGTETDTLFRAFKVDSKTIALRKVGNNEFCKCVTTRESSSTAILSTAGSSITEEAYLRVLEPVLSRTIYNLRYDTENARVYNEKVLVVAEKSATNSTTQADTLNVKLSYSKTNTSTWLAHFTLGLETKASFKVGVPFIGETGVEISSEYVTRIKWGKPKKKPTKMEVTHQVRVPPMTKVTVYLKMTKGTCDVPFVFTQKDTLHNGTFVTTDVQGNTFTGTNYYNIQYDTKEEPITSPTSGNEEITSFCEII